jgi:hypothetical protein
MEHLVYEQKGKNIQYKYYCEDCDFVCCKKYSWERHLNTAKHKNTKNGNNFGAEKGEKGQTKNYVCKLCNKVFKHRTGLWKHNKKCNDIKYEIIINEKEINEKEMNENTKIASLFSDKDLIIELLKQNNEFKELLIDQNNKIIELAKEGKYITNNNNTTNNFNLNIFLNEKCKDALDLMEFVDTLQLKLHDLEETARLGYVEGISKIFMRGLQQLDIYKRPIHCSDLKREVLYIKDKSAWEKEDEDKTRLMNAIKVICNKNIKQIPEWQRLNPEYNDPSSKQNDRYMKLLFNAMSGSTEEEQASNMNKIIRNIAKAVVIDKTK